MIFLLLLIPVANNDICKAERWLKSWSRVNARNGDRRMIEVARDLRRPEIVKLLEAYEHINEFVCATMACDLKAMMHLLALGKGQNKLMELQITLFRTQIVVFWSKTFLNLFLIVQLTQIQHWLKNGFVLNRRQPTLRTKNDMVFWCMRVRHSASMGLEQISIGESTLKRFILDKTEACGVTQGDQFALYLFKVNTGQHDRQLLSSGIRDLSHHDAMDVTSL